jgi:ribose/xylose/arabinose/galactoside ABC-type transport system permease subunit
MTPVATNPAQPVARAWRPSSRVPWRLSLRDARVVLAVLIVALLAAGAALAERFATAQNLGNVLEQSTTLGIVALGQTIVVLAGGIDLSVGAMMSLAGVLFAGHVQGDAARLWPLLAAVVALGAAVGAVNAALVNRLRISPLIVTLGMASVLQGTALLLMPTPGGSLPEFATTLTYASVLGVPTSALLLVLLFALVGLWLHHTRSGRRVYAVGSDEHAARLSGVDVFRGRSVAFMLCGALAALAGTYLAARTGVGDPRAGTGFELSSIVPVVIGATLLRGGRGGVLGTLLGVWLLSLLSNLLNFLGVSSHVQWIVQGVIVLVAVMLVSTGRVVRRAAP